MGNPSGTQTLFTGQLQLGVYMCTTIPTAGFSNYMILPYTTTGRQISAHYFDFASQRFSNFLGLQKEPIAYLGTSVAVEDNFDPKLVNNYYRISNQQFISIGPIPYNWPSNWIIKAATHIMKVRLVALPKPGDKEPIYTFLSDKTMPISITSDKRFVVGTGTQVFTTKQFNIPLNQFFYLRIVYSRTPYHLRFYDCSVEIEVVGFGRDGGDLKCKKK